MDSMDEMNNPKPSGDEKETPVGETRKKPWVGEKGPSGSHRSGSEQVRGISPSKWQSTYKPHAALFTEKAKGGGKRQCLQMNAAMEQQLHDTEEETDFDKDFFSVDPEAGKDGYETPTEEDYNLSTLGEIQVHGQVIKDFRPAGSRNKKLGRDMPRYKHSLRAATPEELIPLPEIFKRVKDPKSFMRLDSTSADTEAYESEGEVEV